MELAVLDLVGKVEGRATEDLLDIARPTGDFRYSAVLGDSPWLVYRQQCRRYLADGFRDFKVKASGSLRRDRRKMRTLAPRDSTASDGLRVRVDANNLWQSADVCVDHIGGLGLDLFAVEEPLQADDLDGFRRVSDGCGTRIILDESLLRAGQLDAIAGDPDRWIANVRVSKMGGVIRALDVVGKAAELGIGVIVGCQVGETSILARAALPVMQAARPGLLAAEGAFGTNLLDRDLATPTIMFGPAGVLATSEAVDTDRGGFGLGRRRADHSRPSSPWTDSRDAPLLGVVHRRAEPPVPGPGGQPGRSELGSGIVPPALRRLPGAAACRTPCCSRRRSPYSCSWSWWSPACTAARA